MMPQSVFPLIWSFLLEPSDVMDPAAEGCVIYFKSVASFMLVSRGTEEAFDDCNGWKQCSAALLREADAKDDTIESYQHQIINLFSEKNPYDSLTTDGMQLCRTRSHQVNAMRNAAARLDFVHGVLSSHLAAQFVEETVTLEHDMIFFTFSSKCWNWPLIFSRYCKDSKRVLMSKPETVLCIIPMES